MSYKGPKIIEPLVNWWSPKGNWFQRVTYLRISDVVNKEVPCQDTFSNLEKLDLIRGWSPNGTKNDPVSEGSNNSVTRSGETLIVSED